MEDGAHKSRIHAGDIGELNAVTNFPDDYGVLQVLNGAVKSIDDDMQRFFAEEDASLDRETRKQNACNKWCKEKMKDRSRYGMPQQFCIGEACHNVE